MSESVSTLFESQNTLLAPSARLTPSQVLDSYIQTRGNPSVNPRISLIPGRFEHTLPEIHLEAEPTTRPRTFLSTVQLKKIIDRQSVRIIDLEKKVRDQKIGIRLLEERVNHYRNKYKENKCAVKTIAYNLNIKDSKIDQLNRLLSRYETHII